MYILTLKIDFKCDKQVHVLIKGYLFRELNCHCD